MKEYFLLQNKILNRKFKDSIGFNPLISYFIFLVCFVIIGEYFYYKTEYAPYILTFFSIVISSTFSEEKRVEFLKSCFRNGKVKQIRILENLICSIPVVLFLLYKQEFSLVLILLALNTIIALININVNRNFTIWTPFSQKPFEFATGFRNSILYIVINYVLFIIAIVFKNFELAIFSILILQFITSGFYSNPEDEFMIWIHNQNPKSFLKHKIKTGLYYSTFLVLPMQLTLYFLYPNNIKFILISLPVGWIYLIYYITNKYAHYPNEFNLTQGFKLASTFIFPPLLLFFIPMNYIKSKNNIHTLLQ